MFDVEVCQRDVVIIAGQRTSHAATLRKLGGWREGDTVLFINSISRQFIKIFE